MNKIIFIILLLFLTNGCKSIKQGLGLEKDFPDEFLIKKIDPIVRPPDFELLPPNSQSKKVSNKPDTKKIIDNNLKKKIESPNTINESSKKIESEILKNLKK